MGLISLEWDKMVRSLIMSAFYYIQINMLTLLNGGGGLHSNKQTF